MLETLPPLTQGSKGGAGNIGNAPSYICKTCLISMLGGNHSADSFPTPLFPIEALMLSPLCPYLHHEDIPLWGQKADLVLQLQHSPHQVHDIAVHHVICAVQVGSGGWVDGLLRSRDTIG